MPHQILNLADDYAEVKITGEMQVRDQEALQDLAAPRLAASKRVCLLVVLEGFTGWEHSEGWDDISFMAANERGDDFAKIAVVGDDRWRDDVYIFMGKGLRKTEIEFFQLAAMGRARAWLAAA